MKFNLFQEKNKRGWIEIVEAFVSILLVAGVLLVLFNKGYIGGSDISDKVYDVEHSILREIQTTAELRSAILGISEPMPVKWGEERFPEEIKNKVIEKPPDYLECIAKICDLEDKCSIDLDEQKDKDIYSQAGVISATIEQGDVYRRINLFCWQS